jgi:hypothetical protein
MGLSQNARRGLCNRCRFERPWRFGFDPVFRLLKRDDDVEGFGGHHRLTVLSLTPGATPL